MSDQQLYDQLETALELLDGEVGEPTPIEDYNEAVYIIEQVIEQLKNRQ